MQLITLIVINNTKKSDFNDWYWMCFNISSSSIEISRYLIRHINSYRMLSLVMLINYVKRQHLILLNVFYNLEMF